MFTFLLQGTDSSLPEPGSGYSCLISRDRESYRGGNHVGRRLHCFHSNCHTSYLGKTYCIIALVSVATLDIFTIVFK